MPITRKTFKYKLEHFVNADSSANANTAINANAAANANVEIVQNSSCTLVKAS